MNGKRYEHSLGAMHLAIRAWDSLWQSAPAETKAEFAKSVRDDLKGIRGEIRDEPTIALLGESKQSYEKFNNAIRLAIGTAALVHDIGHPPFSHALEDFFQKNIDWILREFNPANRTHFRELTADRYPHRAMHENIGDLIVQNLTASVTEPLPMVAVRLILDKTAEQGSWRHCLYNLISGEIDIDRLDYLLRDTRNSGTEFGAFDKERLLQSLELHHVTEKNVTTFGIGFGVRAQSALESFIIQRHQYYRWVVYHHRSVAANRMLNHCLNYLLQTRGVTDSTGNVILDANGNIKSDLASVNLNFFAVDHSPTIAGTRDLAATDDSTIIEWIKVEVAAFRRQAIYDDSGREDYRRRFVALADATIHHTENWVPLWKTEDDYESIAEALNTALTERVELIASSLRTPPTNVDNSASELSKEEAIDFAAVSLGQLAIRSIRDRTLKGGPTALLNAVAQFLIVSGSEGGGVKFAQEHQSAERFRSIADTRSFSQHGFWIFAFDEVVPLSRGTGATQVYRGEVKGPLWQKSSNSLAGLEYIEGSRPQFYCYFVEPDIDDAPDDLSDRLRAAFVENFPLYVYDSLHRLLTL